MSTGGPAARVADQGIWAPGLRLLTGALVINVTLVAFENLSVATVLPVVSRHLGDLRLYGWVFSAFFLSSLVGIVVSGALSDKRGIGLPLIGGVIIFGVGLAIAGTASDMPVLVAGRVGAICRILDRTDRTQYPAAGSVGKGPRTLRRDCLDGVDVA